MWQCLYRWRLDPTLPRQWIQKYPIRLSTRFQIVCGFKNIHSRERIKKVADSHANSPDTCGLKANPERKSCGYKNIRIRVDGALAIITIMWHRWSMKLQWWSVFASETSNDTKQVSSQEKPALNTTYGPKTKQLIRDITFSFCSLVKIVWMVSSMYE